MSTTITESSKEILERLFKREFNEIDFSMEYIYNKAEKLIQAAKEVGFEELAEQFESDKLIY